MALIYSGKEVFPMSIFPALLRPLQVGPLTLKNRMMFPPMTTGYEERDGSIGDRSLAFYERLAKGGVSYVVLGDVAPANTATPTPKLYSDAQIPSFRQLADTLHQYDCKLGLQVFYPEYDVPRFTALMRELMGLLRELPELKTAGDPSYEEKLARRLYVGQQLDLCMGKGGPAFVDTATVEQLKDIQQLMAVCAQRAAQAGVDAIEVHGDRILGSLCSVHLNHRQDEYGGCFENRIRFALETVAAIREAAPGLMLEYKLPLITVNADGSLRGKGGLEAEEAVAFAKLLEQAGVHMIQAAQANHTGNLGDTIPPMGSVPENWTLPLAERIKQAVSIPVATVGRVITLKNGEQILQQGKADMIAYGRSLLADPDLPNKAQTGEPVRHCLNCNLGCVDALHNRRYLSCILNAENGDEQTIFIRPGEGKKKVVIVGGGIAGMEAARVCALRGYEATIYESTDKLGGQLHLASVPPRKQEILRALHDYEVLLPRLGVKVLLNTPCTPELCKNADAVIVAVGAHDRILQIPGADRANVVSAWEVLGGEKTLSGRCLVVGGGLVGTETAEYLLKQGCQVTTMKRSDRLAGGISTTLEPLVLEDFRRGNVVQYLKTRIDAITDTGVVAEDLTTGEPVAVPCDWVVMATGSDPNIFPVDGISAPVYHVGDCCEGSTCDISGAIRTAYKAANLI